MNSSFHSPLHSQFNTRFAIRHSRLRVISLAVIAALLLTLTACGVPFMGIKFITGDIEMRGGFSPPILGRSLSLEDIILMCEPRAAEFDVLITGYDGLAVRVAGEDLSCCELVYSKDYYWELRCDSHPPSVKVKNIKEIAVLSRSEDPYAARFLSDGKAQSLTAGQLLLHGAFTALQEEGTSKLNGKSVTVYTTKRRVALSTLLPDSERLYAVGFDGTAAYFRGTADCYLESAGNSVDLLLADGQVIADLAGVMAEPPAFTISETAVDALHFLERGERVMVLELDSLGWEMLQRAGEEYAPFLHSLQPQKALAAFPSDSKTGIAWMTGVSAPEGDLFQRAAKLGKSCVYIEGSQAFPGVSLRPELSLDDQNVYENARGALAHGALEKQPDLLFAHFHEIDEAAHEHGPYAAKTLEKIREIDGYAKALTESFDGRVILTADHGLHETEEGGSHGHFLPEDMIVPYAIK